ncbi:hypothetical protein BJF90_16970 [Pseudonocardia sp. CNS-004]|nr:hypothetical protein BJF90_16970 [Pseudonocardia sp. CNS-004]
MGVRAAGRRARRRRNGERCEELLDRLTDPAGVGVTRGWPSRTRRSNGERCEELLDRLTDPERMASALTEVAARLAGNGDARRAESVVRRVPGAARRMRALVDVAAAFATTGDHRRAAARAVEAEGIARRTTDPRRLVTMCLRAVDGLVAINQLPAAVEVAEQISDPRARAAALTRTAEALAAYGEIRSATAIARVLDEPERRTWALVAVCEAQAATGSRDEAVSTAEEVLAELRPRRDARVRSSGSSGAGYSRVLALLRLSTALHTVGAAAEAERLRSTALHQVVGDVAEPDRRARAFAHLSIALAAAGAADRAAVLARLTSSELAGIDDRHSQDRARMRVVEAFAAAGHVAWADETCRAIEGPVARVRALTALASAVAGDRAWALLDRAEELIGTIDKPDDRWTATGRIARAGAVLVAGDGPDRSRRNRIARLVVELLATDGWIEAVPAVAHLSWEGFDALVDWLTTRNDGGPDENLGQP